MKLQGQWEQAAESDGSEGRRAKQCFALFATVDSADVIRVSGSEAMSLLRSNREPTISR